jgi:hypothetical protein
MAQLHPEKQTSVPMDSASITIPQQPPLLHVLTATFAHLAQLCVSLLKGGGGSCGERYHG